MVVGCPWKRGHIFNIQFLIFLLSGTFIISVHTFELQFGLKTPQSWCFFFSFLFPSSSPLASPSITTPLCICLLQSFPLPLIFPLSELFSSLFSVHPSTFFFPCFLSLFEHPNLCWVLQVKAKFPSHWAYNWMFTSSAAFFSGRPFEHIGAFPKGSPASGLMASSQREVRNGTVGSLTLVSGIEFCQFNFFYNLCLKEENHLNNIEGVVSDKQHIQNKWKKRVLHRVWSSRGMFVLRAVCMSS